MLTGKPPSVNAWLAQCCLYVLLMAIVKICITLLIQLDFWDDVRDFILSPIINPKVEVVVVMLVIPFFINVSIYVDTVTSVSHPVQYALHCVCILLDALNFCSVCPHAICQYHCLLYPSVAPLLVETKFNDSRPNKMY
jgi:hypothetical protein